MSSSQPLPSGADRPDFGAYDQITYVFDDSGADTIIRPSENLTFTSLGREVYNILRLRVPGSRADVLITYGQLAAQLPLRFADVSASDARLRQVRLINVPVAEVARLWRIGQTLASSATLIGTSLSGTCLTAAIDEIVVTCRAMAIPTLPAIVVQETVHVPREGYFQVAHPNEVGDPAARLNAWLEELERVLKTTYREIN